MTNNTDLLSFSFLNELGFFPKLTKNNIIFTVSNIFLFRANYAISKNST